VHTARRLKLFAHLPPPMLDVTAFGGMPNEEQICTIAAAKRDEQAQVWKKYKPEKDRPDVARYEVAPARPNAGSCPAALTVTRALRYCTLTHFARCC
jgi:hypothetical protein